MNAPAGLGSTVPSDGVDSLSTLERPAGAPRPASRVAVSFVVIGRNEERHLRACLEAVAAEALEHDEILYVDSRSTDRSVEIARGIAGVRVIVLEDARPSAAKGRNRGWRAARGELVQLVDGDACLAPGWTARAAAAMADARVAAVSGTLVEQQPSASLYNLLAHLDWPRGEGPVQAFGGIVMLRRSCLHETGGFPEEALSGEEPVLALELCRRGYRLLQLRDLMARHDIDLHDFKTYWRRCVTTGVSYAEQVRFKRALGVPWQRLRTVKNLGWLAVGMLLAAAGLLAPAVWIGALLLVPLDLARLGMRARGRVGSWREAIAYALHVRWIIVPQLCGLARWLRQRRGRAWSWPVAAPPATHQD